MAALLGIGGGAEGRPRITGLDVEQVIEFGHKPGLILIAGMSESFVWPARFCAADSGKLTEFTAVGIVAGQEEVHFSATKNASGFDEPARGAIP